MQITRFSDPAIVAALMLKGVPLEKFLNRVVPLLDTVSQLT